MRNCQAQREVGLCESSSAFRVFYPNLLICQSQNIPGECVQREQSGERTRSPYVQASHVWG